MNADQQKCEAHDVPQNANQGKSVVVYIRETDDLGNATFEEQQEHIKKVAEENGYKWIPLPGPGGESF